MPTPRPLSRLLAAVPQGWHHELRLIGYASGNFGKNLALGGIDLTLLFILTDLLGIRPASVATLMTVVFLGDLLFDIAAGFLAARARAVGIGYGRIIVLGAIPCCLAFAAIYGFAWTGLRDLSVLALILLIFRGTYAIIDVPHNSLMACVAPDSRSRGRTAGYRTLFSTIASLAIATLLAPAVLQAAHRGATGVLALLGLVGAALACASLGIAARASRHSDTMPTARHGVRPAIAWLPRFDRLAAAMVAIGTLTGFAMPMFGRMTIYLASYVYGRSEMAGPLLLALTLGQLPGVVLWTWLVRFVDKTRLLMASYGVSAGALLLLLLADGRGDVPIGLSVLLGAGLAGVYMFPWGILADVIDTAEFRHGERREAAMVALVLVTAKASAAASTGVIGWVLARLGYVPGAVQSPAVIAAMKGMAMGVPLLGSLMAMLILSGMALSDRRQAVILRALARRRRRVTSLRVSPDRVRPASAAGLFIYFLKNNKKRHRLHG